MTLSGHVDTCTPSESVNNSINWNTFPEYGSVNLTGDETFTIVFNQLIEFCDKDGKAYKVFNPQQLDNPHIYRNYSLGDFDWTFDKDRGVASGIDTMKLKWDITVSAFLYYTVYLTLSLCVSVPMIPVCVCVCVYRLMCQFLEGG